MSVYESTIKSLNQAIEYVQGKSDNARVMTIAPEETKAVMYSTYTMSEGDKCAIEYINQNLDENQLDEILQKWTTADNPKRKKHSKPVTEPTDNSYEEHVSLFDILVAAAQVVMVILAWKWWVC